MSLFNRNLSKPYLSNISIASSTSIFWGCTVNPMVNSSSIISSMVLRFMWSITTSFGLMFSSTISFMSFKTSSLFFLGVWMMTFDSVLSANSNCFLKTSFSKSVFSSNPISPIAIISLFSIHLSNALNMIPLFSNAFAGWIPNATLKSRPYSPALRGSKFRILFKWFKSISGLLSILYG